MTFSYFYVKWHKILNLVIKRTSKCIVHFVLLITKFDSNIAFGNITFIALPYKVLSYVIIMLRKQETVSYSSWIRNWWPSTSPLLSIWRKPVFLTSFMSQKTVTQGHAQYTAHIQNWKSTVQLCHLKTSSQTISIRHICLRHKLKLTLF